MKAYDWENNPTKACLGCGVQVLRADFYSKSSRCKTCHKAYTKQYSIDHPEMVRATKNKHARKYVLKGKYNLTPELWQAMFDGQNGCCACCGRHQSVLSRTLVVDHDHATGKVRALLCAHCNSALGYIKEDANVLQGLAKYIENYCRVDIGCRLEKQLPELTKMGYTKRKYC